MDLGILIFLNVFTLSWYWLVALTFLFLIDTTLCANNEFSWATTILVSGIGLVTWLGAGVNPFLYIWNNFFQVTGFFGLYFAVGTVWSIYKWYFYSTKGAAKLKKLLEEWKTRQGNLPEKNRPSQETKPTRSKYSYAENNKGRLLGLIGHWPFSMLAWTIDDFIKPIAVNIYNLLPKLYARISDRVYADLGED